MPPAPGTRSSAFLRSQSSRAASMSSPTWAERRSMSSTSRSGSSMPRGLPVALRLLTLLELLAQVHVLIRPPHVGVLAGLVGQLPLDFLTPLLLDPHLPRLRIAHTTMVAPRCRPANARRDLGQGPAARAEHVYCARDEAGARHGRCRDDRRRGCPALAARSGFRGARV